MCLPVLEDRWEEDLECMRARVLSDAVDLQGENDGDRGTEERRRAWSIFCDVLRSMGGRRKLSSGGRE